jgi:hypothetical protein
MATLDSYMIRLHYADGSMEEQHYYKAFTAAMFVADSMTLPNIVRVEIIPPVAVDLEAASDVVQVYSLTR